MRYFTQLVSLRRYSYAFFILSVFGPRTVSLAAPSQGNYVFSHIAGSPGVAGDTDGTASAARFKQPYGVAIDGSGNLYVADYGNCTIRKITPSGVVTTLAGNSKLVGAGSLDGTGTSALFAGPAGLAVDSLGNLYVADTNGGRIRKITPDGLVTTLAGKSSDNFVDGTGADARFYHPWGITLDAAGNLYVTDANSGSYETKFQSRLRKVTPTGVVTTLVTGFNQPRGVAVDAAGNVYVSDDGSIYKVSPSGSQTKLAGGMLGSSDGVGDAAQFSIWPGLAVDAAGNVYAADSGNHTIRKVTPDGTVTTIGGKADAAGSADGIGTAARFNEPTAVVVDAAGNLYVADGADNTLRKGTLIGGSQLINISTRSLVSTGANLQIAGFVITGNEPKQVLIRAAGPVLASAFKMTGVLSDPVLTLFDQKGAQIDVNKGWGGDAAIKAAAQRVGAFAWPENSADAALLVTLSPGAYTAHVTGASGDSGIALIEVYDASISSSSRLINISTRSLASTGDNIQIAGFVITGPHAKQVLIRASGPALSASFNMTGALKEPVLTLFDHNGQQINQNMGWTSDSVLAAAIGATADRVGAFRWPENSADSALLVTLPPGLYTAQLTGKSGTTGTALLEVYDADPN
jgi:sugar lactone lactonase YvrE